MRGRINIIVYNMDLKPEIKKIFFFYIISRLISINKLAHLLTYPALLPCPYHRAHGNIPSRTGTYVIVRLWPCGRPFLEGN